MEFKQMNHKKLTIALAISLIGIGCTSQPKPTSTSTLPPYTTSTLVHDPEVHQMSRTEIINATHECQEAGLRAVVTTAKHRVGRSYTDIVVDVTCQPRFSFRSQ